MQQTSDPTRVVPTRRISFDETLAGLPKHFAGESISSGRPADGDLLASHITAGLSAVFPDGEDFFVRSVRHFRDELTDPELKRQVAGFIGQEAMHGREHRAFNDRLAALGYPTKQVERFTKWGLSTREKIATPKANLAATAALEHFTATLAELILSDEETRNTFGHPAVRDLFLWHALEESEHKAVAFDVYKAVGGSERTRVWTMKFLRYGFVLGMVVQVAASLIGDREARRRGVLRASWKRLRASSVMSRALWDQLKDYDRPDFHPDDRNTDELLASWRDELFGDRGRLNDLLVRPGAA